MHIQIAIATFRVTFPWKLCENSIAGSFLTIDILSTEGGGGGGGIRCSEKYFVRLEITEHLNTDSLLLVMSENTST